METLYFFVPNFYFVRDEQIIHSDRSFLNGTKARLIHDKWWRNTLDPDARTIRARRKDRSLSKSTHLVDRYSSVESTTGSCTGSTSTGTGSLLLQTFCFVRNDRVSCAHPFVPVPVFEPTIFTSHVIPDRINHSQKCHRIFCLLAY